MPTREVLVDEATVLIIDDSDATRRMYAKALTHYGFSVREAANGSEGVRMARMHRPDAILMDIAMPVLDAWDAMRLLLASPETASIPVIALTGHTTDGDREGALAAGFKSFLGKPCEPRRVLEEVRRVIEESRQVVEEVSALEEV
jgi:CheY-like chemotaxis protein